jgi:uncharacterized membrane protein YbhN (UPF0104 family)
VSETLTADRPHALTSRLTPFRDSSRRRRLLKVLAWLAGIAALVVVLNLLGVDVTGWLSQLWDALSEISLQYLIAGFALQTVQTTLTAFGWFAILRAGYPNGGVLYRQVLAAYAAGVALNGFLPANIGTFVMLLMFVAMIPGANLPGVLGGMVVQKIFFTVAGTFVYLYLFLSVPGSFELQLGGPHDHPVFWAVAIAGGALLIVILGRIFWRKLRGLWEKAKEGGAILARPRDYFLLVALPSFGAWLAKLGVTAVFLAGYGIPVTFHTIMSVIGGNSLANTVSVTPGGAGVNQAVNVVALKGDTDSATATAYSVGQQLAVTTWNIGFAVVFVVLAFGWTGGRLLVTQSYTDAKVKVAEQKADRAARKEAEREANDGSSRLGRLHRPPRNGESSGSHDDEATPEA